MNQSLVDRLYQHETEKLKEVWKTMPFKLFSPDVPFLHFKALRKAVEGRNQDFFADNIRNNFFPDKSKEEAIEAKRHAINRGISALNVLCQQSLDCHKYFKIQGISHSFDPLEMAALARESWIRSRNGRHGQNDPQLMFQAYNFARAWGLGHLVLIIDESPEIFHSVHYYHLLNQWVWEVMQFKNPTQVSDEFATWDTKAGVTIYGIKQEPFKYRAKIGERDTTKYGSLLMKMFLKKCFPDQIYDTYGIEFLVGTDEDVERLLSYFQYNVKGTGALERYEHVVKDKPPEFSCHKFILRVPVRIDEEQREKSRRDITIKRPLEKYIRLPVEVQIRVRREIDHELYKQLEFLQVFPLWYPREIYEPLMPKD